MTGEYLRFLVEAEQEDALRRLNQSDKKPRKVSYSCKRASRVKLESDGEQLSDTDSDSDDEEAVAADEVSSAIDIDEQLKKYANGELEVNDPIAKQAFDALMDE